VRRSIAAVMVAGACASALGAHVSARQGPGGAQQYRMTGCLQRGAEAGSYLVTDVEGRGPKTIGIASTRLGNLPGFVGRKVELTGTTVPVAVVEKMDKKPPKAEQYMNVTAVRLVSLDVRGPLVPDPAGCP